MNEVLNPVPTGTPDAALIQQELAAVGHRHVKLHVFHKLESTSVWLRNSASTQANTAQPEAAYGSDGEVEESSRAPQLCVTHLQSAGIARRGRTWQAKPGNITFSLLTQTQKQAHELLGLSLVTGIGVATCLASECGIEPQLKWPNDVLIDGAKLGGLLTEIVKGDATENSPATTRILTGIGINLLNDYVVQSLGIGGTSLELEQIDTSLQNRDVLVGRIAASVLSAHQHFFDNGWAPFAEQWKHFDYLRDRKITIHADKSTTIAVARGVNEQGALMVERDGFVKPLYGGNVSVRPIG